MELEVRHGDAAARRKFFDIARISKAPIAIEAVKRIDALFAIEREINGLTPRERLAVRAEGSCPSSSSWSLAARAARQALRPERDRQGHRL